MEVVRRRHPHAGSRQPEEGVDLGVLPGGFLRLASVARALRHRARLPAVLDLAVLGVVDALPEGPLVRFLVDLGAAGLVAAADDEDHGFLAAGQLPDHAVDQSIVNQRLEPLRSSHTASQCLVLERERNAGAAATWERVLRVCAGICVWFADRDWLPG